MSETFITTQGDENWVFSADGQFIFVAGNDGFLRVYSVTTGLLEYEAQLGHDLGAIAISPDGSQLAIVEEVAENVSQSNSWTSNTADVTLYIVDINTFAASELTYTVTGSDWTFGDVTWSDADTLQISQNILPGWSGWTPLSTLELSDGSITQSGSYYAGLGSVGSLLTIPGSELALLGQLGLSSAEYFLIGEDGGEVASNGVYTNNVYGYAEGIEAASGATVDDRIVIVTGGGAHVYDGAMNYITNLADTYPTLGNAMGVGFSQDGQRMIFLDQQTQQVVVIDAFNFSVVATADVSGSTFEVLGTGAEVTMAPDGAGVYFNTTQGIAYVALDLPDLGGDGDDTLTGTAGDDIIDGEAGNDTLYGMAGNDWLIGGAGDDDIWGGDGIDIAAYETAGAAVTIDLAITGAQNTGGAGIDMLAEIEGASGSIYDDQISGNGLANLLFGFGGNDTIHGRGGNDDIYGEDGDDMLYGEAGIDYLFGGAGNDWLDGGTDADRLEGGAGDDTYIIDNEGDVIVETATGGNDTMRVFGFNATIANSIETLVIAEGAFNATGNFIANTLIGSSEANVLTGLSGNDTLDGGGNVDIAVFRGDRSEYVISQTASGVFTIEGPDGTDTLTNIEFAQFDDETLRLLPGTGITVNFDTADPGVYQSAMNAIRDFDGNDLGGQGSWLRIGSADVNGDGDIDQILVNDAIGRFATVGTAPDGLVYFDDHGWAGETRVAGIYIDPLVISGDVVAGSDEDSQRRFQNDLEIENINRVLGADDYDGDGVWEVYFALTDGTAYLRALMHADGNIRYANYQSEAEVIDYLTANGYDSSTYGDWFTNGSQSATDVYVNVIDDEGAGGKAETPSDFASLAGAPGEYAGDIELLHASRPMEQQFRGLDDIQPEFFG
ncbi:hypothetical protein [Qipengyuania nanhaisediminis]|uniref:hypothetical protein n=1 Tax=Qipengyuania nanhaisediminis TaxID=604088 RepID=UPI0038B32BCA